MKDFKDVRGVGYDSEAREFTFISGDFSLNIKKEICRTCKMEATIVRDYAHSLGLSERVCSIKEGSGLAARLFGKRLVGVYEPSGTKIVEVYDKNVAYAVESAVRKLVKAGHSAYSINFFRV